MTLFEQKSKESPGKLTEIRIRRDEAMRGRVRTLAPDGEEVLIDLPRGDRIFPGDMFGPSEHGNFYRISIVPEKVMKVSFRKSDPNPIDAAIKLGYTLGNRHLEVLVEGEGVYLPLTLGQEKIEHIISRTGLPVDLKVVETVISPASSGYFAGEDEDPG